MSTVERVVPRGARSGDHARRELLAMGKAHAAVSTLQPDAQARVLAWLCERLDLTSALALSLRGNGTTGGRGSSASTAAVRQLVEKKRPATAAERVVCLGYFLAKEAQQTTFRTRDVSRLNGDAGLERFTNATVAVNAAVRKGWLQDDDGLFSLTGLGERFVKALPNRALPAGEARTKRRKR